MYVNTHRLQRGLSLVEVFVALLVLSVGLIALAKLQVDLVRGGADARARTIALSLAEEKIEDLRTFVKTDSAIAWTATLAQSPTFEPAWSHIDTSEGGRIPPQTNRQVAGMNFQIDWTVSNLDFTATIPPPSITSRTKNVMVTVSWVNESGDPQQVEVLSNIVEIPPGNVAQASEPLNQRPDGPQIVYTPGEAPDVISVPIDTGTGKRETTKPLPDVQAQGDYTHEVRFDVVNYHLEDGQNVVDRREEFVTVNCRCALQLNDLGDTLARTPARVAFTGAILRDAPGKVVTTKSQTGVVDGPSQQPELCDICCRDHHDGPEETLPDGSTDYNRYNPSDTSDHQHYLYNPDGDGDIDADDFDLASSTGDAYDEACRLKRVNGVFQVFQDWNLETITTLPATHLSNSSPDTQQYYIDYVAALVQAMAEDNPQPDKNVAMPITRDYDFDKGANRQLLSRSIYVDHMPLNLQEFVQERIDNNEPFLEFVPFYEINTTKLADWLLKETDDAAAINESPCPPSDVTTNNAMVLCVTSETIVDEGVSQNEYSRGLTVAGQTDGARRVYSQSKRANTGLTGTFAISTADVATTDDFVTATVNAVSTTQSISGEIDFSQCPTNLSGPEKAALYATLSIIYSGPDAGIVSCETADSLSGNKGSWNCDNVPISPPSNVTVRAGLDGDANTTNPVSTADSYNLTVDGATPANDLDFSICDVAQP